MVRAGSLLVIRHRTRGSIRAFADVDFSSDVEHWPVSAAVVATHGGQQCFQPGEALRIRGSQVEGFRTLSIPEPLSRISTKGGCS